MEAATARGSASGADMLAFMPKRLKASTVVGRTASHLQMPSRLGSVVDDGGAKASPAVANANGKIVVPLEIPEPIVVPPAPAEEIVDEVPTPKVEKLSQAGQSPQTVACTKELYSVADTDSVIFDV